MNLGEKVRMGIALIAMAAAVIMWIIVTVILIPGGIMVTIFGSFIALLILFLPLALLIKVLRIDKINVNTNSK